MVCRPLYYGEGFLRGVLDYVDCQSQTIGTQGYQALASPGSAVSIAITGLLTLFVALYGYRMLLGHTPSVRDGVLALAKIGIVLALATSWPTYRALFYDVALLGPAQMAADVGRSARLPGTDGGLVGRLQGVDEGLIVLGELGIGKKNTDQKIARERVINGRRELVTEDAQQPASVFEPIALGGARVLFLTGTISALSSVRLVTGLLLALGPFFIAFLLFEGTRGLFEGWVRALAGAALGGVAITLLLGAELALVEPWISFLIGMRKADLSIVGAPVELFVVMVVFGLAMLAALIASARIAAGFKLPLSWSSAPAQIVSALRGEAAQPLPAATAPHIPNEQRSRAAVVVEAVAASQRRELRAAAAPSNAPARSSAGGGSLAQQARDVSQPGPVPLGQSYGRRANSRGSASAGRRDRRS
jgi:type IV secretion system protein VirB6